MRYENDSRICANAPTINLDIPHDPAEREARRTANAWRCAGCGAVSPTRGRICDCATNVVIDCSTGQQKWKWNAEDFSAVAERAYVLWRDSTEIETVPSPDVLIGNIEAAISAGLAFAREKVALFMIQHSIATGHGDTLEDLLVELGGYIEQQRKMTAPAPDCDGRPGRERSSCDVCGAEDRPTATATAYGIETSARATCRGDILARGEVTR